MASGVVSSAGFDLEFLAVKAAGSGGVLKVGDAVPVNAKSGTDYAAANGLEWLNVPQVVNMDGPSAGKDRIEVTSWDSDKGWKEYIGGFREPGEVNLEFNWTDAGLLLLNKMFLEDNEAGIFYFSLVFNYSSGVSKPCLWFRAYVETLPLRVQTAEKVAMSTILKISGNPRYGKIGTGASTKTPAWTRGLTSVPLFN